MINHNCVVLTEDDKAGVRRVLDSGQIGPGPEVERFEDELAARFRPDGAAACVSSGTAALRLAMIGLDLVDVSIPTYACSALYHAIYDGTTNPTLLDCDADTFNTPAATVVVHTYGVPCAVQDGAIEDFTHAAGGRLGQSPCGSLGAASVISFGATKPLGCGAGGAVLGPPDLIAVVKDMRDYDGHSDLQARFNWMMSDVTAAIGRSRLARLDADNHWRRLTASRYFNACAERGIRVHGTATLERHPSWYRFIIRVPEARPVLDHFLRAGIQAINPLAPGELLHLQLSMDAGTFPNAEHAATTAVSLPVWPGMSESEVQTVCEAIGALGVSET
jgi:dTDP-4-amino-4,6-dideoxygalactose transaminase